LQFKASLGKQFHRTLSQKNPSHTKKRAGGMAQGIGSEFKPQYGKKKKNKPRDRSAI
jgi:hypothetical protein